jgi:hypothetical protein
MITGRSPGKASLPQAVRAAIYQTVHEFGAEELARLSGQSQGVIDNKANPNATTPHLPTVPDVLSWQAITKDYRILQALAQALGHVAVPVPDLRRVSDAALLDLFLKVGRAGGDFHAAVDMALRDQRFSGCEFARIEREGYEWIAAIVEAMGRIRGLVDE